MSDITAGFHRGNQQSVDANSPKLIKRRQRDRIRSYIDRQGMRGATCEEVEGALDLPHQTASARLTELKVEAGVIPIGLRFTRYARTAAVYVTERHQAGRPAIETRSSRGAAA